MFELIIFLLVLICSLYGLVKSSDYLISTSSILGQRLGISKIVIGLTLVAIGTSLPELFSVTLGLLTSKGGGDFFTGTLIGSNLANSMLIMSVLLYFTTQKLPSITFRDKWTLLLCTLCFMLILFFSQTLSQFSFSIFFSIGSIFLIFFAIYLYITIFKTKETNLHDEVDEVSKSHFSSKPSLILALIFIFSILALNISARGVVYGIDGIATIFTIPQFLLTFTTLALATSLPELVVTIRAAREKQTDIALGNIIGSNISNILLIGGVGYIMVGALHISIITSTLSLLALGIATLVVLIISKTLSKQYYKSAGVILGICYISTILLILITN